YILTLMEWTLGTITARMPSYSIDDNLWGRSIECGILEDPWNEPPKDAYKLTAEPTEAPDEEVTVEVTFGEKRFMSIIPIIGEKVIPKGEIAIFNITENKRR
ncbi:argininosuccinate synthase, partial [Cloacibacillus evryensis]